MKPNTIKYNFTSFFWFFAAINIGVADNLQAQLATRYTVNSAYNVFNTTTSNPNTTSNIYTSHVSSSIASQTSFSIPEKLGKTWIINYGIPVQVSLDYAYLRARMVTAYEENPDPYYRGTQAFKQAVDILGWADFVKISSWAPVQCKVNYRFIPPALGMQGSSSFKYSYQFNPLNAPIRGSNTFYIR